MREPKPLRQSYAGVFILTFVTLLSSRDSYCSFHYEFLAMPDNTTICEGESVIFTCIIKTNLTNFENVVVMPTWHTGALSIISANDDANISEAVINQISKTVTVKMSMHTVQRDKENFYMCRLYLLPPDGKTLLITSKLWYLRVLYFLEDDELHCQTPKNLLLRENEELHLECTGTRCNPPVRLAFWQSAPTDMIIERNSSEDDVSLIGQLIVDRTLHGQTVYCVATSPAFPYKSANCSFGPFNVLYAPSVTVVSDRTDLLLPIIREVNFHCDINAYPGVESYQWSCHPDLGSNHFLVNGHNLTVTLPAAWNKTTSLNVSCEANNGVGNTRSTSPVNVTRVTNGQILDCHLMEPDLESSHDLQLMYSEKDNFLKCSVATSNTDGVTFRWYWRGRLSQERHILEHLPNGSRQFIAQDVFENVGIGIVACEILTSPVKWKACYVKAINHTDTATKHFYSTRSSSVKTGVSDESKENATTMGFLDITWMVVIVAVLAFAIFFLSIRLLTKCARSRRNRKLHRLNKTRSQRNSAVTDTDTPRQGNEYVEPDYDSPYEEIGRESHDLRPLPEPPEDHEDVAIIHAPEQEESSSVSIIQAETHTEDRSRKSANYSNVYASPESSPGSKDEERQYLELSNPTYMVRFENCKSITFFAAESGSDHSLSKSDEDSAGLELSQRNSSTDSNSDSAMSEDEIRHIYFEKNGVL